MSMPCPSTIIMEVPGLAYFWIGFSAVFPLIWLSHQIYQYLPHILRDAVVYGKLLDKKKRSFIQRVLLVPKRWFLHFYVLSFLWNGSALLMVSKCLLQGDILPSWYSRLLSSLTGYPVPTPSAELATIVLALALIVLQAGRRTYECLFISIYSKSDIHLLHYATGIIFYMLSGISVLSESPNINENGDPLPLLQLMTSLGWPQLFGLALFLWASWHQYRVHTIFARLRNSREDINRHMIPRGDLFRYVSCPHYFCEILIYLSLPIILGGRHIMSWLVLVFVVSNQVAAGLEVHHWYQKKFEDYPKDRKALIPFVL